MRQFSPHHSQLHLSALPHSLASEHLCKDAASTPDVHRCCVGGLKQNLRRSVPQSYHLEDTSMQSVSGNSQWVGFHTMETVENISKHYE